MSSVFDVNNAAFEKGKLEDPPNRREYQAEYHAAHPGAATHRKQKEREKMRVAVVYAKLALIHNRPMPDFVDEKLVEPAMEKARKELVLHFVTT